jgi:glyoxylase-like metal-dependent hydrolase (beta-lactamase superfamily II)
MNDVKENGFMVENVGGTLGGEAFLLVTGGRSFLIDAGFAFSAGKAVENLKGALAAAGLDSLDYILLTHSHYDHLGGMPQIAAAFPEAKVVASEATAKIMVRENARKLMRELDALAAAGAGYEQQEDLTGKLRVDIEAKDGEELDLGGVTVRAGLAPGHTKCSMGYYFPDIDFYAATESAGTNIGDAVYPGFLSDYDQAIETIERIKTLAPAHILSPHHGVLSGEDAKNFPMVAKVAAESTYDFVLSRHRAGMGRDKILEDYRVEMFDKLIGPSGLQPVEAFMVNAEVMVDRLIADVPPAR